MSKKLARYCSMENEQTWEYPASGWAETTLISLSLKTVSASETNSP